MNKKKQLKQLKKRIWELESQVMTITEILLEDRLEMPEDLEQEEMDLANFLMDYLKKTKAPTNQTYLIPAGAFSNN